MSTSFRPGAEAASTLEKPLSQTVSSSSGATYSNGKPPYMPWRERIRNFAPAWFYVVMGVSVTSLDLYNITYVQNHEALKITSFVFWWISLILFFIATGLSIARMIMFPEVWGKMMRHPYEALYLACIPMAMVPIENGMSVGIYHWDGWLTPGFLYFTWACWWVTTTVGYVIAYGMFHKMITAQRHSPETMTCTWMAPFIALTVDASSGALMAPFLRPLNSTIAVITVLYSFCSLIIGITVATLMMALYIQRLVCYGYPPASQVWSSFLPLSGMAQSGFTIMVLGEDYAAVLPLTYGKATVLQNPAAPEIIKLMGYMTGAVMWCLCVGWLIWALFAVIHVSRTQKKDFKFGLATWGFVFPCGVFAIHTIKMYLAFDSRFFRVLATMMICSMVLICLTMMALTIKPVIDGTIFHAPCLEDEDDVAFSTLPVVERDSRGHNIA